VSAAAIADRARLAFGRLHDAALARRLPGLWMLAWADGWLGRFELALAGLRRAAEMAATSGRELVLVLATLESVRPLQELGRLAEAVAAGEEALDRARLSGTPQQILAAHSALAGARLATGDVTGALREADEARTIEAPPSIHAAGQPGWCLGTALTAAGNADRAVPLLRGAVAAVVPVMRPFAAADLVEAELAAGDLDGARAALAIADSGGATPWAAHARAAVALAEGRARAAAAAAAPAAAPALIGARLRLLEGRALAAAGDRAAAIRALSEAETVLARRGAMRWRDEAARELRRLGHRVRRPAPEHAAEPLGPLTDREREIAELVAGGRTNREVAEQLVLSVKTIEAHLRNIYAKLGVRSRVELARAAERAADRGTG
jgi:DNA-binding NarL/FixJ family response regulator